MPEPILIVEDDNTIRVTVGNFLARQGFDVEVAEDGTQALAMLKERSFSLILLDLRLPDMNGLDILATIRESDDRPLVVIMTAYPEVRTAVAALKAGAYDYINKPFDLEDLRELIGRALETPPPPAGSRMATSASRYLRDRRSDRRKRLLPANARYDGAYRFGWQSAGVDSWRIGYR